MKRFLLTAMILMLSAGSALCASIISDFDDGTMQGWTAIGDVAGVSNPGAGGNPDGYLRMVDQAVGGVCWTIAPAQVHGNWHDKVSLSADLTQTSLQRLPVHDC